MPMTAESAKNIPEFLECFTAVVEGSQIFLCAQGFSPGAWEALVNVPFEWGAIMGTPVAQRFFPAQGGHAEYSTGAKGFFPA